MSAKVEELCLNKGADYLLDDSELIKAYEKCVNEWREEMKQSRTKDVDSEVTELKPGPWVTVSSVVQNCGTKETSKNRIDGNWRERDNTRSGIGCTWAAGSMCRAKYSEDGVYYEAMILEMFSETCKVHYFGYENEEIVFISELLPSEGKKARKRQKKCCKELEEEAKCKDDADSSSDDSTQAPADQFLRSYLPRIPAPPVPLKSHMPGNYFSPGDLSSLLYSWYISGYHAGYYDATQTNTSILGQSSTNIRN